MLEVFEVSDAAIAFPVAKNIPKIEDIPKEFLEGDETKWHKVTHQWFYGGGRMKNVVPKEGVDKTKAIRAIKSVLGSYGPEHEHKMVAVAYMLSEWFDEFEIEEVKQ